MSVDDVLLKVNGNGPYQKRALAILSIVILSIPCFIMSLPFILEVPAEKDCKVEHSDRNTYAYEFELVCDREIYIEVIESTYFVGMIVGAWLTSKMSDEYGRKKTWLLSTIGLFVGFTLALLSVIPEMMVLASFLIGFFALGSGTCAFVLISEIVTSEYRNWYLAINFTVWPVSNIFVYCIMWANGEWRIPLGIGLLLCLPIFFFQKYVDESPKFLYYNKGKTEAAEQVLRKIAFRNGKELPVNELLPPLPSTESTPTYGYSTLFRVTPIRKNFLICAALWLSTNMGYYGLLFLVTDNYGNEFVKGIISAFLEIIAGVYSAYSLNKLGRKKSTISMLAIAGICCSYVFVFQTMKLSGAFTETLGYLCYWFARFFISSAFLLMFVYTAELFPTCIRNRAFGGLNFFSRMGSFMCPWVILGLSKVGFHPIGLFGVMLLFSALLSLKLEETFGKALKENLSPRQDKAYVSFHEDNESNKENQ